MWIHFENNTLKSFQVDAFFEDAYLGNWAPQLRFNLDLMFENIERKQPYANFIILTRTHKALLPYYHHWADIFLMKW